MTLTGSASQPLRRSPEPCRWNKTRCKDQLMDGNQKKHVKFVEIDMEYFVFKLPYLQTSDFWGKKHPCSKLWLWFVESKWVETHNGIGWTYGRPPWGPIPIPRIYRFYIHQLLLDGTLRQICEDCEDCEALRHSANVQLSTPAVLNYPGYVPINQHLLSVYVL